MQQDVRRTKGARSIQRGNRGGVFIAILLLLLFMVGIVRAVTVLLPAHGSSGAMGTAVPVPDKPKAVVPLHVQNGKIVDPNGAPVTLLGASHAGLEANCPQDPATVGKDFHLSATDFKVMYQTWGMNTARVLLSSELWNTCATYKQSIQAIVDTAKAAHFYLILTLQFNAPLDLPEDRAPLPGFTHYGGNQYPLPDNKQDVQFWKDLASTYKDEPNVMFDLFSEPHNLQNQNELPWPLWMNGGKITVTADPNGFPPYTHNGTYTAIGMPVLARIVRQIASNTLIFLAGVSYAADLSGIANGYNADDVANVVYSTHPFYYTTKPPSIWPSTIGVAAKSHAVMALEFGQYDCGSDYVTQIIQFFNTNGINWLAWKWDVTQCENTDGLLLQWDGTPNGPYGHAIHDAMVAKSKQAGILP